MRVSELAAGHAVAVHRSSEERRETCADFVAAGVARHEKVTFLDGGDDAPAVLARQAREHGLPRREYAPALTVIPAATVEQLVGMPSAEVRETVRALAAAARDEGFTGLRITGVLPLALRHRAGDRIVAFERAVAAGLAGHRATVLCQYEGGQHEGQSKVGQHEAGDDDLATLLALHDVEVSAPAVHDDGMLRVTVREGAVHVAGEIDMTNRDVLDDVLGRAAGDAATGEDRRLDLGALHFVDAAGLRRILDFARREKLAVRTGSPAVRRLLGLFRDEISGPHVQPQ